MALLTLNTLYPRVAWDTGIAYVSTTQYSSTMFLEDLDILARDYWSHAIFMWKWSISWDIWDATSVAMQNEYTKPLATTETIGASVVETVMVNFDWLSYTNIWDKKFIPCSLANDEQKLNWEYYLENQPVSDPIYFERDWSLFIAPEIRTTTAWTGRIRIKGIRNIASRTWTTSTSEVDIKLPEHAIEPLIYGCVWKAHARNRRDNNIILQAKQEWIQMRDESIALISQEVAFINELP